MAEFKLGRIRFVWKGAWTTGTTYYIDDVVRVGGKTYICVVGHTAAADFNTDLEYSPTKWNQMSDGQNWKGTWSPSTFYQLNDVVKYSGNLYICNDSHTSAISATLGLEVDQSKWTIFAEGFEWKGNWSPSTRYKTGDLVRYGGYTYVCNTGHTSAVSISLGLEADQGKWDDFNQGLQYKGNWNTSTRYKINDVVKFGAGLWICTIYHTSTDFLADQANWSQFVEGFEFEDTWDVGTEYQPGDIVRYGGNQYVAKTITTGTTPSVSLDNWSLFSEGYKFQSDWVNTAAYKVGEIVRLNGYTYVATADSASLVIPVTLANATTDRFTTSSTVGLVAGMTVRFTGTTFGGVMSGARYYVKEVFSSTEFSISTTATGPVFQLTAASGSMTATASIEPPNTEYWAQLNSGIKWQGEWLDDTEYNLGDAVRYGTNAYICIQGHRSEADDGSTVGPQGGGASNSRPDKDATGTYWNLLAMGSETSVLNTRGDMVYYGGAGPTRLPVGLEGQILVSNGTDPEWRSLGKVDQVYYVASHGTDGPFPTHGGTLDRPWKTIRYACQQVEKGPRNPNAAYLLEMNRVFIQREVTEWIDYQINHFTNTVPTPASKWYNFDYDEHKCERDTGFIIDRIIWDITHGGNLKTLAAALTYINALSGADLFTTAADENGTGTYTKLSTEGDNDVEAYNYMLTVIESILQNQAPVQSYQVLNGDNSTATVSQFIDTGYVAEAGIMPTISSLVGIVTTALTDGTATNLPERSVPNSTIYIKSGRYRETLPIIVPAETALVGDEVRSVNAGPREGTTPSEDSFYTAASMDRLEEVVDAIIRGASITPSVGNNLSQSTAWPVSTSTISDLATAKIRAMKHDIDYRLGTTHAFKHTDPKDYNTVYLTGYGDARSLLIQNKKFIQEEVIAYLANAYPTSEYGKTKARRDAGYIIDALVYDLTYEGNALSVQAGLAYYDGDDDTQPQIPASIKALTLDALGFMKTLVQTISVNGAYAPLQTAVTRTTGTAGSAAASTVIGNNIDDVIKIVTTGPAAVGTTVTLVDPTPTDGVNTTTALITAYNTLTSALTTIKNNVATYLSTNYSDVTYSEAKAKRDAELVLKAVGFDFMFNGNYRSIKAAMAYLRGTAAELFDQDDRIKEATRNALKYVATQAIANVGGNTTAISRITSLMKVVDDVIYSGSNEGQVCQSNDRTVDWAVLQLERNRDFIVQELHAWMDYNYVNFNNYYNSATCSRDIGYIVDAVISDLATGSNFASSVAGESYYRIQAALVPSAQMMQTVAAVTEAKRLVSGYVTHSSQYTAVNAAFDNVIAILQGGLTSVPAYTWTANATATARGYTSDAAAIQTNRAAIVSDMTAWMITTYPDLWTSLGATGQAKCTRDVGYIVDALTYDLQYGGDYQVTVAGSSYYSFGTLQLTHSGEKAAEVAAIGQIGTLVKGYTGAGADTVIDTLTTTLSGIVNTGATEPMTYTLPVVTAEGANTIATYNAIVAGKADVRANVTTYITETFSTFTYNTALCNRDTHEIIDALKWDLKYSSNYKTLLCSRWYSNAVIGSLEEDMFYLRNGTGVRNMTLDGLKGDLTPANVYGTRRVTAGAYASLDPGWGPDDFRTWIIHRSPYVQNCCTFGYGAIGQKIDGALHNGGYDSIVSNDFTQIISDGIGAWVTNNARAELVSVFTYYSHIGYLAENGGRIRGTNGNNSYGDFGSVAEGYDATETPGTGEVDNHNFVATVGHVFTDSADDIYRFEFDNAGSEYTTATWSISGAGGQAVSEADEFRDDAVFQVHLLDLVDDSTLAPEAAGNFGGFGYLSNANTAQGGTGTQITIAATDAEISSAYIGMKIYLTGGTGVGQYGIINTYNSGTKVATVIKETTGLAGWDHIVSGTAIVSPDASTTYVIEPRAEFTAPSFASTASTLPTSGTWTAVKYGTANGVYTALTGTTSGSGTGATWQVIRNGSKYTVTNISSGTKYQRLDTITLAGTELGGVTPTNDITINITSVNSTSGAIQAFEFTGFGHSGRYVAIRSGSSIGATSEDGINWVSRTGMMPSAAQWSSIAHGVFDDGSTIGKVSRFVAVSTGLSSEAAYSADGITFTAMALPSAQNWTSVTFGEGRFVAINSDSTKVAVSYDGEFWDVTGTLPGIGYTQVTYGMGLYVAIASGTANAAYSTDGVNWIASTGLPASSDWSSVSWGNGRFVAVSSTSGTTAAYSLNGNTWVASTLPATASWSNITYGQGVFLAVSGSTQAATSEDGINWTSRTLSTAASGYSSVTFGNPNRYGLFVGVGAGTGTDATYVRAGATAKARVYVAQEKIYAIRIVEPGSAYDSAPTLTITDPNNVFEAPFAVRIGKGALANPSFKNRGVGYVSASAELLTGDGYGDFYQSGQYISVKNLTKFPVPGSNIVFGHLPDQTYKLVNVLTQLGSYPGSYRAFFQIAPEMKTFNSPAHGQTITTRIRYSQVRLTGHDFLDVGTGNFDKTNYPNGIPDNAPSQANETVNNNGGRVFYTSTDQDGNFRVGELFTIEQSTGVATLNADAFNIAGLQELTLGEVSLGGGSAAINEFSTDPFFTANSDNIVPTQRAIKAYIASQIGGGGASLNVNSVTSGYIYIAGQEITTTTGGIIQMRANFEFQAGVTGYAMAWPFFLT